MSLTTARRRFLRILFVSAPSLILGCGTILYPERRGQPKGRLDWGVVALDGLGLLLFFVPGVIAFAVDFATGAIYLPPESYGANEPRRRNLDQVTVPPQELTPERIEQVVSDHIRKPVALALGKYRTQPLDSLDDFWSTRDALAAS